MKSSDTDKTETKNPAKECDENESDDDSHYINSYSNYNIHLEMLQVLKKRKTNSLAFYN